MIREELIKRSPFRILENSINGGLGKGNIGVIAANKGVGKTACLVHLATDKLFQGKHVVHVSFSNDTSHIVSWYEDIFEEIAARYNLEGAMEVHDDIVRNRIILNIKQNGVTAQQMQKSLLSIINDGHFNADLVVIDGYDFSKSSSDEVLVFKQLAEQLAIEIWFTVTLSQDIDAPAAKEFPAILDDYKNAISIVITLKAKGDFIHLTLVKDHNETPHCDLHLKLDPQILLIADET